MHPRLGTYGKKIFIITHIRCPTWHLVFCGFLAVFNTSGIISTVQKQSWSMVMLKLLMVFLLQSVYGFINRKLI